MTWAKVDDKLYGHPKARSAGIAAMGLWVMAMSHCVAYMTDGFVSDEALLLFVDQDDGRFARAKLLERASRLVRAHLWTKTDGGYLFHDWSHYQPSRESWEIEKDRKKERMRRLRAGAQPEHGAVRAASVPAPCAFPDPDPIPTRSRPKEEENKEIPILGSEEGKTPQLFPDAVIPPTGPSARSVFDQFQDIRSRHLPKAKRQVFSPDRARKIEQALASHGHDDVVAALNGYFLDPFHQSIQFGKADVEFILRNARHIEQFRDHWLRHARVSAKPAQSVAAKVQPTAEENAEVMARLEGWAREAGAASFEEYASGAMAEVSSRLQVTDDADPFDLGFDAFMGRPGASA